jgi:hypothetical protein
LNILAKIFHALVVKSAVAAWNFIRKHPVISTSVVVFVLALPFLWQSYQLLRTVYLAVLTVVDWVKGKDADGNDLPLGSKLLRWAVVGVFWVIVPGTSLLFVLFNASAAIGRSRDNSLNVEVST